MSAEFTTIIELLRDAGAGATWLFVGYLAFKLLMMAVCFIGVALIIKVVVTGIGKIISVSMENSDVHKIVEKIRDAVNVGSPGRLITREVKVLERKLPDIIECIRKGNLHEHSGQNTTEQRGHFAS
jgi:hypothetical protein